MIQVIGYAKVSIRLIKGVLRHFLTCTIACQSNYPKFQKKKKQKTPPATTVTTTKKPSGSAASIKPIQARLNPNSDTLHQIEHHISLEDEDRKDEEQGQLLNSSLRPVPVIPPANDNNNDTRRTENQGPPGEFSQKSLMNGFQSESCLLEQLRISENWRHLMAVERSGQVKLNLKEQFSARL